MKLKRKPSRLLRRYANCTHSFQYSQQNLILLIDSALTLPINGESAYASPYNCPPRAKWISQLHNGSDEYKAESLGRNDRCQLIVVHYSMNEGRPLNYLQSHHQLRNWWRMDAADRRILPNSLFTSLGKVS